MSKKHIQTKIQINVDKNINFIIKFLIKVYPYSLIPFASCEGDVKIYKKNKFAGAAYLTLIVRNLDNLDDFIKILECEKMYNLKIQYYSSGTHSIVRHFKITWDPNYNKIINDNAKNSLSFYNNK